MQEFGIRTEIIEGEPFISISDLIALVESGISERGTPFDLAVFNLAFQLKGIKNKAIQTILPKGNNDEAIK